MTRPTRLRRSELSTPGSSDKMMAKAAASEADLVFLDLEDAVAPNAKVPARGAIVERPEPARLGVQDARRPDQRRRHRVVPRRSHRGRHRSRRSYRRHHRPQGQSTPRRLVRRHAARSARGQARARSRAGSGSRSSSRRPRHWLGSRRSPAAARVSKLSSSASATCPPARASGPATSAVPPCTIPATCGTTPATG